MKILCIELQNINSLRSDTPIVIDFESDQFKDVALFGITGPTGAGKTTILDAITIALYHAVPRFDQSHYSAGLEDVVSKGAGEAFSRIRFEAGESRYEAFWSLRLVTKTGKKLANPKPTCQLLELETGRILAETKTEVESKVIEITQLSYAQFLRSVLLAQGQFAAFLSAAKTEKGGLLEQITGQDIYKRIGVSVSTRINDEKGVLEGIRSQLNTADLLADETRTDLEHQTTVLSAAIKDLHKQSAQLDVSLKWFEEEEKLASEKQSIESQQGQLAEALAIHRDELQLLERHLSAEPFQLTLSELKGLEKDQADLKHQQTELKANGQKLMQEESELKLALARLQESTAAVVKRQDAWQPVLQQVTMLDTMIDGLANQLTDNREKQGKSTTELNEIVLDCQLKQTDIEAKRNLTDTLCHFLTGQNQLPAIEKRLTDWAAILQTRDSKASRSKELTLAVSEGNAELVLIRTALTKANAQYKEQKDVSDLLERQLADSLRQLQEHPLQDSLTLREKLSTEKQALDSLLRLSSSYADHQLQQTTLAASIQALTDQKLTVEAESATLAGKLNIASRMLEDAERILALETRIKSLEEERSHLQEGKPCPLCGSLTHPFVTNYTETRLTDAQVNVATGKNEVEQGQKALNNSCINLAQLTAQLESQLVQRHELTLQLNKVQVEFETVASGYSIAEPAAIEIAQAQLMARLRVVDETIASIQELDRTRNQVQEQLNRQHDRVGQIEQQIASLAERERNKVQAVSSDQEELQVCDRDRRAIEQQLIPELEPFQLVLPDPFTSDAFIREQKEVLMDYHAKLDQYTSLIQTIDLLRTELKGAETRKQAVESTLSELQHHMNELSALKSTKLLERASLLPAGVRVEDKRNELQQAVQAAQRTLTDAVERLNQLGRQVEATTSGLKSVEKSLSQKQTDYIDKQQELDNLLKQTVFSTKEEVEHALLTDEKKTAFRQLKTELNNNQVALEALALKWQKDRTQHQAQKQVEASKAVVLAKVEELKLANQEHQKKLGEISERFRKDDEIRNRNQLIVAQITAQEKVIRKWTELFTLLGGSKDAFNTYVQRLTLKQLLRLANQHLLKLNNRYSLDMGNDYKPGEELDFVLVDHFQMDEKRYVETSSGGERFLISLSLALGLSDIASKNVRIGSLFIDEGFGTLDNTTLETVISTLETLHSQGKMIGIISHVDSLKERIPTQIIVQKRRNGVSTLEIQ